MNHYCQMAYCHQPGRYVVENPDKSLTQQIEDGQFYCLRHARVVCLDNGVTFQNSGPINVYKVTLEWSRK